MASPLGGMSVMVFPSGSFAPLVDDDDEFRWSVMVFPSGSFARLGILGWVSRRSKMRIA